MLTFNIYAGCALQAIEHLKAFEKKDQHLKAMAATNLAFIYFLEGKWVSPIASRLLPIARCWVLKIYGTFSHIYQLKMELLEL